MTCCAVAIVGAGPYGLSIAAHLKARGVDYRIFGSPMDTWRKHMPAGMRLKSEGFASSLFDPEATFTLAQYCKLRGLPYADIGTPVPLDTFISYGLEFQRRFVPELEERQVVSLQRSTDGFQIGIEGGEIVAARNVVVAVGLTYYAYVPEVLSALPKALRTHSSEHRAVDAFKGRDVAIVGGGASALDLAAELHQAGASVQLVCRAPAVRIHDPPEGRRSLVERLRSPMTEIGAGWKSFWCTNAPQVFRRMPVAFRLEKVKQVAGPAGGWFIRDQVVDKVPFNVGVVVTGAEAAGEKVSLQLSDTAGLRRKLVTDHVIAATGYRVDLRRLPFLDAGVQAEIEAIEHTPVLSANFESSVPGLYFVGASAANTFGPLLRFACGAKFTARRVSRRLARSRRLERNRGDAPAKAAGELRPQEHQGE